MAEHAGIIWNNEGGFLWAATCSQDVPSCADHVELRLHFPCLLHRLRVGVDVGANLHQLSTEAVPGGLEPFSAIFAKGSLDDSTVRLAF